MQMEALECGAASLTMILSYYDKWIPLEQVRRDCGVSRDGSNAKNMYLAAEHYGLICDAYRFEVEDLQKEATFPCIIHWGFDHFVVLDGFKGDYAVINDPAKGNVKIQIDQFADKYTGICMMFEPGENFVREGKPKSMLDFAKKRLKGTGIAFAFVILTSVITSLMELVNVGFNRIFYDELLTGYNPDWFYPFIIGLSVFAAVQIIASAINVIFSLRINGKMAVVSTTEYMWKLLCLPMDFFSQRMAGDLMNRMGTNETIANSLINTLAPLFLDSVMMIFYLVVLIRYSPFLTLIGIMAVVMNFILSRVISKKRVNITRALSRDSGNLEGVTLSGIEMVETIKASGAEDGFFERWSGFQASANAQNVKFSEINSYFGILPTMINMLLDAFVTFAGVVLIIHGEFTIGMLTAFTGFLASFMAPVSSLISAGQTLQEMRTDMERVEDVLQYPEDTDPLEEKAVAGEYGKLTGNFCLKDITFGYSPLGEPLIKNFNLNVKTGQKIALVGSSGCGKSTISKLISGLNKPWSGEITFDGKRIGDIDRNVFTGSVAVVDQDIILFEDTISNNIKMWDTTIKDFEVILAARDANIHEDIMQRPGGYNYKISEGGKDFSGGQRQRLEIARVLAQDPTIIILDEATSALDAKTEYEVIKAINDRGITCIVVAHRLSTIRDCDEIIVLDHGDVVERGTHDELFAKDGYYKNLVTSE
ncbi:MAG: NHLP family bacteriocin export ABC transporter peptidase/permease/ATPase subunit [Lachnospiraceae bacterium]|nr:NHLP family bacteriocin export ABC transporter peptidase/permease/ATPase subunit [Lachnospiraceae bacterium]